MLPSPIRSMLMSGFCLEKYISTLVPTIKGTNGNGEESRKRAGLTPIGKEAFVFFVNPDNKVDSLTVSEIRDLLRNIPDWLQLKGRTKKLSPFNARKIQGAKDSSKK